MSDEHESYSSLVAQHSALRLANGIRALILPRPASPTFALQLLVRAGSRHDGAGHGLAHLVEHLVFRAPGGARVDLFAAVESLGGEVGASTLRDYTTFELVVAAPDAGHALALLPALVRAPAADAASVRGEQQIVCRELRERAAPAAALWDLLLAALWGDDPLVHAPGGSTDAVLALTPEETTEFQARHYRAPSLVVAAAGSCSTADFAAAVETGLGNLSSQSMGEPLAGHVEPCPPTAPSAARPPRDLHAPAAGPMTYLAVGLAVAGLEHPDRAALRALDVALGRGGASRLARALAARGLRAAVQSRYVPYAGAGVFAALAACPPSAAEAVRAILAEELRRLSAEPPDDRELLAAQARHIGTVYRQCESNLGLANTAGVEALFDGSEPPLTHLLTRVAEQDPGSVAAVARRYFAAGPLVCARVGPEP